MEAVTYDSNTGSVRSQEKADFTIQAGIPAKIWHADGTFGDDLVLRCTNPNFCYQALLAYHAYLKNLLNTS